MEINKVICWDSLTYMKSLPDKCIDLILTDPPYWIWEDIRKADNSGRKEYEWNRWDLEIPPKEYFDEIKRISKNQIIWGWNYFIDYLNNTRCYLTWDKIQEFTGADTEFARTSFNSSAKTYRMARCYFHSTEHKKHPTQKPKELFKWCLENYSKPWDIILDCFAWSGTTAVACIETGRNYICIEKEEKYCEIGRKRIANTTPPLFVI
jgi:site-specific DNA-methyltransferase (adenine-specific)